MSRKSGAQYKKETKQRMECASLPGQLKISNIFCEKKVNADHINDTTFSVVEDNSNNQYTKSCATDNSKDGMYVLYNLVIRQRRFLVFKLKFNSKFE